MTREPQLVDSVRRSARWTTNLRVASRGVRRKALSEALGCRRAISLVVHMALRIAREPSTMPVWERKPFVRVLYPPGHPPVG